MADLNFLFFLDHKQKISVFNDRFMIILSNCNGMSQIKLTIIKTKTQFQVPKMTCYIH